MKKKSPLLAFFGHHKAATTWMNSIISVVCADLGRKPLFADNPEAFDFNLIKSIEQHDANFLFYRNSDFNYVKDLDFYRGFHVVRDPRDVIVSAYFSHLHSHPTVGWPELAEHRRKLEKLSKYEGLMLEMNFSQRFIDNMFGWNYFQPNVIEIKMEDLIYNPYGKIVEIFDFLEILDTSKLKAVERIKYINTRILNRIYRKKHIPFYDPEDRIPAERLLGIVYQNSFARQSGGRKAGEENVKSHYRKGVPGDWINHFEKDHIEFFKENYNDVLLKLGYESDPQWWMKYVDCGNLSKA